MRAHAEAVRDRLELLLLFVNAVPGAPPPRLMHKWSVRRVHQADDAVIDAARQIGAEICGLIFVAEHWHAWRFERGLRTRGEPCSSRPWIRNEDPNEAVVLFTSVISCVDAIDLQLLIGGERRNQLALSAVRVKLPSVIAALYLLSIKLTVGKRHSTMRAGVSQGKGIALGIAPNHQWNFEQHGFVQLAAFYFFARQGAIPEAGQHQRIRRFALRKFSSGHGLESAYHKRSGDLAIGSSGDLKLKQPKLPAWGV